MVTSKKTAKKKPAKKAAKAIKAAGNWKMWRMESLD